MNKFRVWCPYKKDFIVQGMTPWDLMVDTSSDLELLHLITDECVWQQSMGAQDAEGREIYEGDIVSVIEDQHRFVVKFGKVKRNIQFHDSIQYFGGVEINGFYFHHLLSGNPCFSIYKNKFGEHDLARTKVVGHIFEEIK